MDIRRALTGLASLVATVALTSVGVGAAVALAPTAGADPIVYCSASALPGSNDPYDPDPHYGGTSNDEYDPDPYYGGSSPDDYDPDPYYGGTTNDYCTI